MFGNKKGGSVADAFTAFSKNVVKESGTEGVEEFAGQAMVELSVYGLDPDRDIAGNLTTNTILGATRIPPRFWRLAFRLYNCLVDWLSC